MRVLSDLDGLRGIGCRARHCRPSLLHSGDVVEEASVGRMEQHHRILARFECARVQAVAVRHVDIRKLNLLDDPQARHGRIVGSVVNWGTSIRMPSE